MRQKNNNLGNTIASFLGLGVFIVLLICAIVFLSYLFIIGAVIGLILYLIALFRAKFMRPKTGVHQQPNHVHHSRTIDQDDS